MPENFNPEVSISPEQKIAALSQQIAELETAKQEAASNFAYTDKSRKKKKEDAPVLELPDIKELKPVDFIKDENGRFHFEYEDNGYKKELTMGDLVSDMEWGIYYDLNHVVVAHEYRIKYERFRKVYVERFYQQKIDKLVTEQLLIRRLEIDHVDLENQDIANVYKEVYASLKEGDIQKEQQDGFKFEKMLTGLLLKIEQDLGSKWNFSIVKANVIDDVEMKTDLIVKLPQKNRGVGVDPKAPVMNAQGFQVTLIDMSDEKWKIKQGQVERVKRRIKELKAAGDPVKIDDLVLFEGDVDTRAIKQAFKDWENVGRRSGGPENFLPFNEISKILKEIFKNSDLDLDSNKTFKESLWEYFKAKK